MRLRSSTLEVMAAVNIYKGSGRNILGLGKDGFNLPLNYL
jgi:hypothetical protein